MTGNGNNMAARRGSRWSLLVWGAAAGLLLLPLVAMQFTHEVAWTAFDFAVFGTMLAVACGIFELAVRLSGSFAYRAGVGVAVVAGFLLVWVNLAVGMIGDEDNPANLMFAGILAIGVIGAVVAKFRAGGMARTLVVMALAQIGAGVVALMIDGYMAFVLIGGFSVLWLISAWLFGKAAAAQAPVDAV